MCNNEVNVCLGRKLKSELRLAIWVCDGKVARVDDVHSYQDITPGETQTTHPDILYQNPIGKPYVDKVDIGLVRLVVHPRMEHLCPAYRFQSAFVDYFSGD